MIVYHGSYCRVERPELTFSREKLDFGKGFYITPIREQAERWSKRFLRARKAAILNVYELDENCMLKKRLEDVQTEKNQMEERRRTQENLNEYKRMFRMRQG